MATKVQNGIPTGASTLAHQNFVSSSRVAIIWTYTAINLDIGGVAITPAQAAAQSKLAKMEGVKVKVDGLGEVTELICGTGWKSAQLEQTLNVEQIGALGWFDIVETIAHNVSGNTFQVEKATMRWGMLANIGVAPWGVEVLTAPMLSAYMFDPKELIRGNNFGYVRIENCTVQNNSINSNTGQTLMERVTFRPNRIKRVNNPLPTTMIAGMKKLYSSTYADLENIPDTFTYQTIN